MQTILIRILIQTASFYHEYNSVVHEFLPRTASQFFSSCQYDAPLAGAYILGIGTQPSRLSECGLCPVLPLLYILSGLKFSTSND